MSNHLEDDPRLTNKLEIENTDNSTLNAEPYAAFQIYKKQEKKKRSGEFFEATMSKYARKLILEGLNDDELIRALKSLDKTSKELIRAKRIYRFRTYSFDFLPSAFITLLYSTSGLSHPDSSLSWYISSAIIFSVLSLVMSAANVYIEASGSAPDRKATFEDVNGLKERFKDQSIEVRKLLRGSDFASMPELQWLDESEVMMNNNKGTRAQRRDDVQLASVVEKIVKRYEFWQAHWKEVVERIEDNIEDGTTGSSAIDQALAESDVLLTNRLND